MAITPLHPALLLEREVTESEMTDMIRHEGLVGLPLPEDLKTAQVLMLKGIVEIVDDPTPYGNIPHIVRADTPLK